MKENFFKKLGKVALVAGLSAIPKESKNPDVILGNKEVQFESKKGSQSNTTKGLVKSYNLENQKQDENLEKSLEKLRLERINFLTGLIQEDTADILTNTDRALFDKKFEEKIAMFKDFFDNQCEFLEKLKGKIDTLNEKETQFLLDFQIKNKENIDSALQKSERGEFKSFQEETDFQIPEYEILYDSLKKNDNLYMQNLLIGFDLSSLLLNYPDIFSKVLNSHKTESDKKKIFNLFFEEIKNQEKEDVLSFKSNEEINKAKDEAWSNRESIPYLENKLLSHKKELENIEKNLNQKDLKNFVESSKVWLMQNIASFDYVSKLIKEGYSPDEALKVQKERLERIKKVPYVLDPEYRDVSRTSWKDKKASINYNANDLAIRPDANSLHELEHASTLGQVGMSKKAKDLYEKSFISPEEFKKILESDLGKISFPTSDMGYYSFSTEIDARKKVLEYEMEKLGIKKYGEIMTMEHYEKLIKLMKEGKLDQNSMQIILMLTKEGLIEILNTIAKNSKNNLENIA